ncbi:hypothetical protein AAFF_G00073030 [Aldrovandia affinis]|uniref:Integrase catalytic domain-containing protein n=1 Tax=Aldrovandia affinis TaxID=143900 RepID=A0AAD7RYI0_9TELE|nr:hypothetical protein AAFF_G00073030 [Aldrovandia affinis]
MRSADVACAFTCAWIARFGALSDISSDRGPQFTYELWGAVAQGLGVKLHHTTTYHPAHWGPLQPPYDASQRPGTKPLWSTSVVNRTTFPWTVSSRPTWIGTGP